MGDRSNASGPLVTRICKANVGRFGVKVDDAVSPQLRQYLANHGPSFAEQVFGLGSFPVYWLIMIAQSTYSSNVRGWLVVGEQRLELAQVGPDRCVLRQSLDAPPSAAELVIEIDGEVRHQAVFLRRGISRTSTVVALSRT